MATRSSRRASPRSTWIHWWSSGCETQRVPESPSTAWLVGYLVQTRATRAVADVRDDARIAHADAMLAAGYAAYLGVPVQTLYQWRRKRTGPAGRRVGRHLRYDPAAVRAWFAGLDDAA